MEFKINTNRAEWNEQVLMNLLADRTSGGNIVWGTDDYEELWEKNKANAPITLDFITDTNLNVIQPRILKDKEKQKKRTKKKAEVFTPSWVCNAQNNLVDNAWFDRENVFNTENEKSWTSTIGRVEFPDKDNKTWKAYVNEKRLEITCGEAPYLVSRYDTVTGEEILLKDRIGLLDRKMRIVGENTYNEKDWLEWAEKAFQSIYGFEYQGDNLFIARENLLNTYCDYMQERLNRSPKQEELLRISEIISWNLWQMDGLTYTIPNRTLSDDFTEKEKKVLCVIKDWETNEEVIFQDLLNQKI